MQPVDRSSILGAAYRQRLLLGVLGALLAILVLAVMSDAAQPFLAASLGPGQDARAYWVASSIDPYAPGSVGQESAYLYSPAFLQILEPFRALAWTHFLEAWTAGLMAALFVLAGPVLFTPLLVLALIEVWGGNIHLLLTLAIVAGFRWPAAWAFVLLTKVTPGVGLVWFAVRREWRSLAIAGIATGLVAGTSFALAPGLWFDWLELLRSSTGSSTVAGSVPIPLVLRLPVAVVIVAWAARTDRAWLVPLGAMLALPVIWWGGLSMLIGCVALRRTRIEAWVLDHVTTDRLRPSGPAMAGARP